MSGMTRARLGGGRSVELAKGLWFVFYRIACPNPRITYFIHSGRCAPTWKSEELQSSATIRRARWRPEMLHYLIEPLQR